VAQPGETPWQAAWGSDSTWKPTWEQWANQGAGGWTCTRSIVWAPDAPRVYNLGDIGPGGGLVFLIANGVHYEMAPKSWGANETVIPEWCSDHGNPLATGTVIGTGSGNTTSMLTSASPFVACTSSAPAAVRAYLGGGFSDWFLPALDELNAMCNYSRSPSSPVRPDAACNGGQDATFATNAFGFASVCYWSSSQYTLYSGWCQDFDDSDPKYWYKGFGLKLRPIRTF